MDPTPKTTELAAAVVAGAAGQTLFVRVLGRVHRYFFRLVADVDAAEDCTQETLLELQRSLREGKYDPQRSFNTWIFMKAHKVFVAWCRKRELHQRPLPEPEHDVPATDVRVNQRLDAEIVLQQLSARLGAEVCECFVLRHESELSLEDLSTALGCTRRTVSRRLAQAHAWIDAYLEGGS